MNIFFLDETPFDAAISLHDVHCVKMILESAQLLCNAHHYTSSAFPDFNRFVHYRATPFKVTHINHPCSIWARATIANYSWLSEYLLCLCGEFQYRRGKHHKVEQLAKYLDTHIPNLSIWGMTVPPLCMPLEYQLHDEQNPKSMNEAVESYRNYYLQVKWQDKNGKRLDKWSFRGQPKWWTNPESRGLV